MAAGGHYAQSRDLFVRYEVSGSGPPDLLAFSNGSNVWTDQDDEPHWSRFDRRLAAFSRLIRFDPSGVGMSDPLSGGGLPTCELWMHDTLAVLDAVGSSTAALLGVGASGGHVAMLVAATYPERCSALVLFHSAARLARAADYPWGSTQDYQDRFNATVGHPGHDEDELDVLALVAPSLADDPEFRAWWKRAGERSGGPRVAQALNAMASQADLRAVLSSITVPTLVLYRDPCVHDPGHARYLADNIPGAKLVEVPGSDFLPYVADIDPVVGEIEEFVTGARAAPNTDRVLATILFTDIVDSTKQAASKGDRRWHEMLDNHDRMAARQLHRLAGRQVKTTGDGILATFDGPARAIQCGLAIVDGARQLGMEVRVGIHAGEVERRGEDIAGISVHIAARVQACADPGEVWVSRTVKDLVAGSDHFHRPRRARAEGRARHLAAVHRDRLRRRTDGARLVVGLSESSVQDPYVGPASAG